MMLIYGIIIAVLGLMIGSFLNVLIYRIPLKKDFIHGKSMCPRCEKPILWYDNVPLLSYIFLRGKCRHCHDPISIMYPIVEVLTCLMYLLTYLVFGFTIETIYILVVITCLIPLSVIDFKHHYIPDRFQIIIFLSAMLRIITLHINDLELSLPYLIGGLLGFTILYGVRLIGSIIYKKEAMGFGDVKLIAVSGFFIGWTHVLLAMIVAFITAAMIETIKLKITKNRQSEIAFGPYLSLGIIVSIFLGNLIISWYLSLLGVNYANL